MTVGLQMSGCGDDDTAGANDPDAPEQTMKRLERIVHERVDGGRSTGIVAGMVFPGGRTSVVAYGDSGTDERLDERSVFEIGSITKVFTGTLLAEMVRRGEVKLSDPVESLLPPSVSVPSRGGQRITLEDLATQTSGLPRLPSNLDPKDPWNPYADYTVKQLYEFLDGYELPRDIGAQFEYSNLGVGLLGHALALRADKSYDDSVRERILEPLMMPSSGVALDEDMAMRFVAGHDASGRVVSPWDLPTLAGAGALRSSMSDMLNFAAANLGGDGGGALGAAMATARSPRESIDGQTRIGLTWMTQRCGGRDIVWHDGGTGGFFSFIGLDEARDTAIVVLGNSSKEGLDDIGFHMLNSDLPLTPPPKQRKEITLAPGMLERYAGVYDLEGMIVRVTCSPEGLSTHIEGQDTERLYAESETEFFYNVVDAQVVFDVDARGRVTGGVLHQEGQTVPVKKVG